MKRLNNPGKEKNVINSKTGFFSQLFKHLKAHFYLFVFLLVAYGYKWVTLLLFDGKGIGGVLNQISDFQIIIISIFVCITCIIKNLKS